MQHEGRQAQGGVSTILEEIRQPIMLGFREHSNNLAEAYSLWCGIPFSKESHPILTGFWRFYTGHKGNDWPIKSRRDPTENFPLKNQTKAILS